MLTFGWALSQPLAKILKIDCVSILLTILLSSFTLSFSQQPIYNTTYLFFRQVFFITFFNFFYKFVIDEYCQANGTYNSFRKLDVWNCKSLAVHRQLSYKPLLRRALTGKLRFKRMYASVILRLQNAPTLKFDFAHLCIYLFLRRRYLTTYLEQKR